MVIAAQALSVRRQSRLKGFRRNKMKEQLHFNATIPTTTDFSKVLMKADMHSMLALVEIQA